MRSWRAALIITAATVLGACATTSQQEDAAGAVAFGDLFGGGRVPASDVERIAAQAAVHPLGSRENPVRVNMPAGQRAYLSRLRCVNGSTPSFERVGNFGAGIYGSIIDGYRVRCASSQPEERTVFLDMYHPDHRETGAVPGYTIVP